MATSGWSGSKTQASMVRMTRLNRFTASRNAARTGEHRKESGGGDR